MTVEQMYDYLAENGIASEEFIRGAISVGGWNTDTMEQVLYYNTGYREFDQFIEEEMEEE